ncbi:MAG: hypothetical protein AAFX05_04405 [Planctomycetota bacterium]
MADLDRSARDEARAMGALLLREVLAGAREALRDRGDSGGAGAPAHGDESRVAKGQILRAVREAVEAAKDDSAQGVTIDEIVDFIEVLYDTELSSRRSSIRAAVSRMVKGGELERIVDGSGTHSGIYRIKSVRVTEPAG